MTAPTFTRAEKLAELRRELRQRENVYPRLVLSGRLKQEKADRQIAILEAIAADYAEAIDADEAAAAKAAEEAQARAVEAERQHAAEQRRQEAAEQLRREQNARVRSEARAAIVAALNGLTMRPGQTQAEATADAIMAGAVRHVRLLL